MLKINCGGHVIRKKILKRLLMGMHKYTHNEVLFSQKREENLAIWDNMDGPSVK